MSQTTDKQATIAQSKLAELLAKMGVEAEVSIADENPPTLHIGSSQPAALIGHRGEGMRSIQHLLRILLLRDGHELPVLVDIEGYRQKQQEQLTETTVQKAKEVAETGRLAVLPPMTSYERRVVHLAVSEFDDLVTESLGEGSNRRVMIKKKE